MQKFTYETLSSLADALDEYIIDNGLQDEKWNTYYNNHPLRLICIAIVFHYKELLIETPHHSKFITNNPFVLEKFLKGEDSNRELLLRTKNIPLYTWKLIRQK